MPICDYKCNHQNGATNGVLIFYKNEDSNAFFMIGLLYSKKGESQIAIKCFKKSIINNYITNIKTLEQMMKS